MPVPFLPRHLVRSFDKGDTAVPIASRGGDVGDDRGGDAECGTGMVVSSIVFPETAGQSVSQR